MKLILPIKYGTVTVIYIFLLLTNKKKEKYESGLNYIQNHTSIRVALVLSNYKNIYFANRKL